MVLLIGVGTTAGIGYAVSVHQSQVDGSDADACLLRADRCQRERAESEAMNARLMAEKRQLEAREAQALSRVERDWEAKVASVQEACQQQRAGLRDELQKSLVDDLMRVSTGAPAPLTDVSPALAPVLEEVRTRLVEVAQHDDERERQLDELRTANSSLSRQVDLLSVEREMAAHRDKDLLAGLRAERAKRHEFQFRDFQARSIWSLCADEPHHRLEECEAQVRTVTNRVHDRWTECLAFSDTAPDLTRVEGGHTVPSYWARVWRSETDDWWVSLCDPHLPEAEGL